MGKESFVQWLSEAQQQLGIAKKDHALKNPAVIQRIVETAASNGKTSESLNGVVSSIVALKAQIEAPV